MRRLALACVALVVAAGSASAQRRPQAVPDSIVVRVSGANGGVSRVNGVVQPNDSTTARRFQNATTPIEVRLAARGAHAVFRSVDGSWLEGEIFVLRNGKALPRATGRVARGMMLYASVEGEAGFAGIP